MPFSISITVVALAVTGRSLPSSGQLSNSCAKIALYGKNCTLRQQRPNCGKITRRKITITWGGLDWKGCCGPVHSDTLVSQFYTYIIVSRILYALPAWGVFMSAAQSGRIDAFLKRAHKCEFSKELLTVNELLAESGRVMFKKMKSPMHCLHRLLPPNKNWTTTSEIVNPMFYPSVLPVCRAVLPSTASPGGGWGSGL